MNLKNNISELIFTDISILCEKMEIDAYVVGGFVRDIFLNKKSKDVDIVLIDKNKKYSKVGLVFAEQLAKIKNVDVTLYKNFGTAQMIIDGVEYEFVGARKESYDRNSRKPVVEDGTLYDDQIRRDFTMNSLYISLNKNTFGNLVDVFGGVDDINNKIIKTPIDPDKTFFDDPLRMLRAIRFATKLNFEIDENVLETIKRNSDRLKIISEERIITEFNKILETNNSKKGIELLDKTNLLVIILPEVTALKGKETIDGVSHKDNFYHILCVMENIDNLEPEIKNKLGLKDNEDVEIKIDNAIVWFKWIGLLHDIGKVSVKNFQDGKWTFYNHQSVSVKMFDKIFKRLKLPLGREYEYVKTIIENHERIKLSADNIGDSSTRRINYIMDGYLYDGIIFGICDTSSKYDYRRRLQQSNYWTLYDKIQEVVEKDGIRNFKVPIDGLEIMEMFNLTPCKTVGILKEALKDAILDGLVENNRDSSIQFLKEYYEKITQ